MPYTQFYTLTKLQGSQTDTTEIYTTLSFTLLQNYKVLKQINQSRNKFYSFTLLQNYKVLKQNSVEDATTEVFYTLTKLQGSQTKNIVRCLA